MTDVVTSEIHQDSFLSSMTPAIFEEDLDEDHDQSIVTVFTTCDQRLTLEIENFRSTQVSNVGLQVWRGALFLSDFILSFPQHFKDKSVLEVASGTGVTSLVAASMAKSVVITDVNRGGILELIQRNVDLNRHSISACPVQVSEINFFNDDWTRNLSKEVLESDVILAADVVYDPEITFAFFQTLQSLIKLNNRLSIFIAIEKRFRASDEGAVAPNFQLFMDQLRDLADQNEDWHLNQISTDFPQHFQTYTRVKELVLFQFSK